MEQPVSENDELREKYKALLTIRSTLAKEVRRLQGEIETIKAEGLRVDITSHTDSLVIRFYYDKDLIDECILQGDEVCISYKKAEDPIPVSSSIGAIISELHLTGIESLRVSDRFEFPNMQASLDIGKKWCRIGTSIGNTQILPERVFVDLISEVISLKNYSLREILL
jgi:hypothetical protein